MSIDQIDDAYFDKVVLSIADKTATTPRTQTVVHKARGSAKESGRHGWGSPCEQLYLYPIGLEGSSSRSKLEVSTSAHPSTISSSKRVHSSSNAMKVKDEDYSVDKSLYYNFMKNGYGASNDAVVEDVDEPRMEETPSVLQRRRNTEPNFVMPKGYEHVFPANAPPRARSIAQPPPQEEQVEEMHAMRRFPHSKKKLVAMQDHQLGNWAVTTGPSVELSPNPIRRLSQFDPINIGEKKDTDTPKSIASTRVGREDTFDSSSNVRFSTSRTREKLPNFTLYERQADDTGEGTSPMDTPLMDGTSPIPANHITDTDNATQESNPSVGKGSPLRGNGKDDQVVMAVAKKLYTVPKKPDVYIPKNKPIVATHKRTLSVPSEALDVNSEVEIDGKEESIDGPGLLKEETESTPLIEPQLPPASVEVKVNEEEPLVELHTTYEKHSPALSAKLKQVKRLQAESDFKMLTETAHEDAHEEDDEEEEEEEEEEEDEVVAVDAPEEEKPLSDGEESVPKMEIPSISTVAWQRVHTGADSPRFLTIDYPLPSAGKLLGELGQSKTTPAFSTTQGELSLSENSTVAAADKSTSKTASSTNRDRYTNVEPSRKMGSKKAIPATTPPATVSPAVPTPPTKAPTPNEKSSSSVSASTVKTPVRKLPVWVRPKVEARKGAGDSSPRLREKKTPQTPRPPPPQPKQQLQLQEQSQSQSQAQAQPQPSQEPQPLATATTPRPKAAHAPTHGVESSQAWLRASMADQYAGVMRSSIVGFDRLENSEAAAAPALPPPPAPTTEHNVSPQRKQAVPAKKKATPTSREQNSMTLFGTSGTAYKKTDYDVLGASGENPLPPKNVSKTPKPKKGSKSRPSPEGKKMVKKMMKPKPKEEDNERSKPSLVQNSLTDMLSISAFQKGTGAEGSTCNVGKETIPSRPTSAVGRRAESPALDPSPRRARGGSAKPRKASGDNPQAHSVLGFSVDPDVIYSPPSATLSPDVVMLDYQNKNGQASMANAAAANKLKSSLFFEGGALAEHGSMNSHSDTAHGVLAMESTDMNLGLSAVTPPTVLSTAGSEYSRADSQFALLRNTSLTRAQWAYVAKYDAKLQQKKEAASPRAAAKTNTEGSGKAKGKRRVSDAKTLEISALHEDQLGRKNSMPSSDVVSVYDDEGRRLLTPTRSLLRRDMSFFDDFNFKIDKPEPPAPTSTATKEMTTSPHTEQHHQQPTNTTASNRYDNTTSPATLTAQPSAPAHPMESGDTPVSDYGARSKGTHESESESSTPQYGGPTGPQYGHQPNHHMGRKFHPSNGDMCSPHVGSPLQAYAKAGANIPFRQIFRANGAGPVNSNNSSNMTSHHRRHGGGFRHRYMQPQPFLEGPPLVPPVWRKEESYRQAVLQFRYDLKDARWVNSPRDENNTTSAEEAATFSSAVEEVKTKTDNKTKMKKKKK